MARSDGVPVICYRHLVKVITGGIFCRMWLVLGIVGCGAGVVLACSGQQRLLVILQGGHDEVT